MTSKHSFKLQIIKERLEKLCCPFIEDGTEQWMAELLLHPSETRYKLLIWVLCNFDSDFDNVISKTLPVINSRIDSRHQRILFLLNIMGVCNIDDIEIIKGTASQKKQLMFWDSLIDMVYTSQIGHNYVCDMNGEASTEESSFYLKPAKAPSLADSFQSSCTFIDTLVREHKMKMLMSSEIHLFSPDLEGKINDEMKTQETPSVDLLTATAVKISMDIANVTKELEGSLAKFNLIEPEQSVIENYCRKIDLALKTFSQMIDSFLHCYSNDIEVWCKKDHPTLSNIGSAVHSTNLILQGPTELNGSLQKLNKTMSSLSSSIHEEAKQLKDKCDVDLTDLEDIASTLQESIERVQYSS